MTDMLEAPRAARRLTDDDDFAALTELIHLAYAPLAAKGLNYWGSRQTVDDTRHRWARGETWVAVQDGAYVATVTLYAPGTGHGGGWYAQPDVAKFGQLCVHPRLQGTGLGARMLNLVEDRARAQGAAHLACDTSEQATALIALYTRRGYVFVEHMDMRPKVNYRSVLLSLDLRDSSTRNDHA
ncbi:MAG: GNAT family N-acetyltransferase [Polyangiales bacterium]|nr:GNAT family N-acetyltransferase [Sandaracinaceae bacterium]